MGPHVRPALSLPKIKDKYWERMKRNALQYKLHKASATNYTL